MPIRAILDIMTRNYLKVQHWQRSCGINFVINKGECKMVNVMYLYSGHLWTTIGYDDTSSSMWFSM